MPRYPEAVKADAIKRVHKLVVQGESIAAAAAHVAGYLDLPASTEATIARWYKNRSGVGTPPRDVPLKSVPAFDEPTNKDAGPKPLDSQSLSELADEYEHLYDAISKAQSVIEEYTPRLEEVRKYISASIG